MTARQPTRAARSRADAPTAAERARTVATCASAWVHTLGTGTSPLLGATTTTGGDVLLVVPRSGGLAAAVRRSPLGDLPARLTVTRRSLLPLRDPVRGQLELVGWLTAVAPGEEPALVLDYADACPADVLLDVGLTATLLRLDVAEVLLTEGGSCTTIEPEDFAAARPDALAADEVDLLGEHARGLAELSARVRLWAGEDDGVHLLGVDRFGVLFRVECPASRYDLRVPFPAPADDRTAFGTALAELLRCARA
ncbi:DUF2470 domain-containing protein [Trujillonella endophytica]|uniref:DUF2470 domain-containing protein n=1 Tax=Trujillonella endophytica TaxID=673521 RepID=A0A1H8WFZ4_9ACTN|nr:DUF2470 domain-containing protein [Trujillella endophytica]SEP26038.1 hypothetical protein SAMN05660991_04351 [Trujillella endophytica]